MNTLPPPLSLSRLRCRMYTPDSPVRSVQSLRSVVTSFTALLHFTPSPSLRVPVPPREADVQYIYNRPHPGVRFGWLHMYSRGSHQQYTLSLGRSSVRTLTYTYNQFGMPKTDIRTYGRTWPIEDPTLDSRSVPGFRQSLPY